MTNVLIYCRVSSDEQNKNSNLGEQEKICRSFCDYNNFNVIEVFKDTFSWKKMERPGFSSMMNFLRLNNNSMNIEYCVVKDLDRFGRFEFQDYFILKEELKGLNVNLVDTYWILKKIEAKKFIQSEFQDIHKYEWALKDLTNIHELIKVSQARDEWITILQRTIPKEISNTNQGQNQRQAIYWYINSKVLLNWKKATTMIPHPEESKFIIKAYELIEDWTHNFKTAAEEINAMWYKSRFTDRWWKDSHNERVVVWKSWGLPMTEKKLRMTLSHVAYAGLINEKWTNWTTIKALWDWLVSIDTFNKVNERHIKIVQGILPDWTTKYDLLYWKNSEQSQSKRQYWKNDSNFPYRKLVYSPFGSVYFKGSFPKGNGGCYATYHALIPMDSNKLRKGLLELHPEFADKKSLYFGVNKVEFENTVFTYFDCIRPNQLAVDFFVEYLEHLWEKRTNNVVKEEKEIKESKNDILIKIKSTKKDYDDYKREWLNSLAREMAEELERLDKQLATLDNYKESRIIPDVPTISKEAFTKYAIHTLLHLSEIVHSDDIHMVEFIFGFVFKRVPHYDELVNMDSSLLNPVFSLELKDKNNDGRTNWNGNWKPNIKNTSKDTKRVKNEKSGTKIIDQLFSLLSQIKNSPSGEFLKNLWWQPQLESNRPRRIWSPEF